LTLNLLLVALAERFGQPLDGFLHLIAVDDRQVIEHLYVAEC